MTTSSEFKVRRVEDLTATLDDDEAMQALDVITDRVAKVDKAPKDGIIHISDAINELEVVESEKGTFLGLPTGYASLDEKMGGLEPGSVVLVGGETSNGKSMMSLNIALNIAKNMNNVLYMSLEMTRKQIWQRVATITRMTKEELTSDLDFSVQESFNLEYNDIEPLVKRAVECNDCKVVFVDYLQYLGRGMSEKEVAKMSQIIKRIALRYNLCMVVVVSLRKAGADMKNKRKWYDIETEDLMGTAAIGYDADTVIVTSRKDLENKFQRRQLFVKVLKTRNGDLDYNNPFVEMDWDSMLISETEQVEVVKKRPQTGEEALQGWEEIESSKNEECD